MWIQSDSLSDLLRRAFIDNQAAIVKRCIRYRGAWYAYL